MEYVRRQVEVKYVEHNRVSCVHTSMRVCTILLSVLIPPQAVHLAQTDCEAQQGPENWVNYT